MALRANGQAKFQAEPVREELCTGEGWYHWESGGGCVSLRLDQFSQRPDSSAPTGFFSQVTDLGGMHLPGYMDDYCFAGLYDPDGQNLDGEDLAFVGTARACMAEVDAVMALVRTTFDQSGEEGVRDLLHTLRVERGWRKLNDEDEAIYQDNVAVNEGAGSIPLRTHASNGTQRRAAAAKSEAKLLPPDPRMIIGLDTDLGFIRSCVVDAGFGSLHFEKNYFRALREALVKGEHRGADMRTLTFNEWGTAMEAGEDLLAEWKHDALRGEAPEDSPSIDWQGFNKPSEY